ncbi:ribosome biogenesis protein [candidate division MSBL1 archaeon SCGC-AAA261F19]|uniref:Ribosome biogenesis protein Nop10 n=1 Tax=candidate division MSBL1 archaeon SCGC-AAA261F19 TaxID=1698275 RepID=A0A133V9U4_9EURY|nr:ribosome biogenesis protein [candidate division MSBL1 archaeon SCGC-AAA261F19]
MKKCKVCGGYTLKESECPKCGGELGTPHPPKFSPEDPYGKYRRRLKREALDFGKEND